MRRQLSLSVVAVVVATAGAFFIGRNDSPRHPATTVASVSRMAPSVTKVRETFTLLPCSMETTLGMEGCAEHEILILDSRIDGSRREVFKYLHSRAAQLHFVRAERDWLDYRRSTCLSRADAYEGGSFAPVSFADCLVLVDREHVVELATLKESYAGG